MCVNYRPSRRDEIIDHFKASVTDDISWPDEVWKDYPAPIIRLDGAGEREAVIGTYGMVPRRHIPEGVKVFDTMNARSESVGEKRSFAKAWRSGQTCLVPMRCFFEPNYESGKHVRWCIDLVDQAPFAVAGLWREWREDDGSTSLAFTQLTVSADAHPFMSRFHQPNSEKRSLVIVPQAEYGAWLSCRDQDVARSFMTLYPPELMAGRPEPKPSQSKTGKREGMHSS
jgi:putative SOS response-associated peptidase YedK